MITGSRRRPRPFRRGRTAANADAGFAHAIVWLDPMNEDSVARLAAAAG
jgi:hypothetical protein